jgi:hypothetical protein
MQMAKMFRRLAIPHAPLRSIIPARQPQFRRERNLLLLQSPRHLDYILKPHGQVEPIMDMR